VIVAIQSLAPASLPVLAAVFLGERLNSLQIIGLFVVLLASFGLSISRDELNKPKLSKAMPHLMVLVVLLNVISLLQKHVYNSTTNFTSAYLLFSLGIGLGGVCYLLMILRAKHLHDLTVFNRKLRHIVPVFLGVELISIFAEYVSNLAVSKGPVSLVRVIEGIQPVYVLFIALLLAPFWPKFFRETYDKDTARKLILMVFCLAGLFLVK
jgi:drug/metabolite transporter (DMT)-like permease